MPTIGVKKRLLDEFLGESYTETQVDELCFAYGLELDDVVSEMPWHFDSDDAIGA